ncbi:MAG: glutaredoxin 3 [Gammaproteobacteria bacterium]|nr:glutaredoxin 3 [Gammaproteobacteria bacterium]
MANVEIYLTTHCPYCIRARRLLDNKGISYDVVDVGADRELWRQMMQRSQRRTVPQVFIDEVAVGGFDDLVQLEREGRLDALLGLE